MMKCVRDNIKFGAEDAYTLLTQEFVSDVLVYFFLSVQLPPLSIDHENIKSPPAEVAKGTVRKNRHERVRKQREGEGEEKRGNERGADKSQ